MHILIIILINRFPNAWYSIFAKYRFFSSLKYVTISDWLFWNSPFFCYPTKLVLIRHKYLDEDRVFVLWFPASYFTTLKPHSRTVDISSVHRIRRFALKNREMFGQALPPDAFSTQRWKKDWISLLALDPGGARRRTNKQKRGREK